MEIHTSECGLWVDVRDHGIECRQAVKGSWFFLPLPVRCKPPFAGRRNSSLRLLPAPVRASEELPPLPEVDVSVGILHDPCTTHRLHRTLRVLERLAARGPRSISINTRSPLILLALPVLKSLRERVSVRFILETDRDESSIHPSLPRTAERLSALCALRDFGIRVEVQLAPLLAEADHRRQALEFARQLHHLECAVAIFPPADLFTTGCASALDGEPLHIQSPRPLSAAAHQLVYCALRHLSPGRVTLGKHRPPPIAVETRAA